MGSSPKTQYYAILALIVLAILVEFVQTAEKPVKKKSLKGKNGWAASTSKRKIKNTIFRESLPIQKQLTNHHKMAMRDDPASNYERNPVDSPSFVEANERKRTKRGLRKALKRLGKSVEKRGRTAADLAVPILVNKHVG